MKILSTLVAPLGLALALTLVTAGCGDDGGNPSETPDSGTPQDGGDVDAGAPPASFTAFVIDQIQNHTNATDAPAPIDFDLPDPDGDENNTAAYDPLFD